MTCNVEWCSDKDLGSRGLCNRHYIQNQRHGFFYKTHKDKPDVVINNGAAEVSFHNGLKVLVDEADLQLITEFNWYSHSGYASTRIKTRKAELMHRLIMDAEVGIQIDHKNGNGLDNRRSNLRLSNQSENMCNRKAIGVYHDKRSGKWYARVKKDGVAHNLGTYKTFEEAKEVRDKAALEMHGEFAYIAREAV